jgi:alpha-L-arabinofuranosidase
MIKLRRQQAWCLLACVPVLALAQTAAVQVDGGTVLQTVNPAHFGINTTLWDPALATGGTVDQVYDAGIELLRLPGGSMSDEYHWLTNTSRNNAWQWASGFDKSSWLMLNTPGATGMVTLNYGSGTPEEAAAWVAYANFPVGNEGDAGDVSLGVDSPTPGTGSVASRDWHSARHWANLRAAMPLATDDGLNFLRLGRATPMDIHLWEVGNENYGSWEFDLQQPAQGAVTYATRAKTYIDKIHAVDSTARVGVSVVTGNQYNNWTSLVLGTLNTLGTKPDFVIYHRYEQGPGAESDAGLLQKAKTWPDDIADLRAQLNTAYGNSAAAAIEIFVTENNSVYTDPGEQSTSLVNGLYLVDSVANVMKTETQGFVWWSLRGGPPANNQGDKVGLYGWRTYGDYGILTTPSLAAGTTDYYTAHPTYYAFKLLKFFARGGDTLVSATSNDNLLSVFAAVRSVTGTSILVINKDPANTKSANFTLTAVPSSSSENYVYSYGKSNDDAARPNGMGCADIVRTPITITGNTFTASFPSYSMSVISLGNTQPPLSAVAPVIVAQPAAASVTAGASTTFTGGASGCPPPIYRWQRAPSGSTTFTDLADGGSYSGTSTGTLTVSTTTAMSGDQFRLSANAGGTVAQSNAATLTVAAPPVTPPASGGGGGGFDALMLTGLLGLALRRQRRKTASH